MLERFKLTGRFVDQGFVDKCRSNSVDDFVADVDFVCKVTNTHEPVLKSVESVDRNGYCDFRRIWEKKPSFWPTSARMWPWPTVNPSFETGPCQMSPFTGNILRLCAKSFPNIGLGLSTYHPRTRWLPVACWSGLNSGVDSWTKSLSTNVGPIRWMTLWPMQILCVE